MVGLDQLGVEAGHRGDGASGRDPQQIIVGGVDHQGVTRGQRGQAIGVGLLRHPVPIEVEGVRVARLIGGDVGHGSKRPVAVESIQRGRTLLALAALGSSGQRPALTVAGGDVHHVHRIGDLVSARRVGVVEQDRTGRAERSLAHQQVTARRQSQALRRGKLG